MMHHKQMHTHSLGNANANKYKILKHKVATTREKQEIEQEFKAMFQ